MVVLATARETVVGMNRDCFLPNRVPLRPQSVFQADFGSAMVSAVGQTLLKSTSETVRSLKPQRRSPSAWLR